MNEDQQNINNNSTVGEPVNTPQIPEKVSFLKKLWAKLPQKIKDILISFYSNKKIFWLVTGAFGLVFLTIILGLLFGSTNPKTQTTKKVVNPTPQSQETPAPETKDALTETDDRLKALKTKINNLDVKQSRMSPPEINFKVSF